jgi:hypothetical protein
MISDSLSDSAKKMKATFSETKLINLRLVPQSRRVFKIPNFLAWTIIALVPHIYWRESYTYLLCSVIAGLGKGRTRLQISRA